MKIFLCVFLLWAAVFTVAYGALGIYPADPNYPGHCFANDIGEMDYGQEKQLKNCIRANCRTDGTIQIASCGAIYSKCGLLPKDESKPYPDCCPQPKPC